MNQLAAFALTAAIEAPLVVLAAGPGSRARAAVDSLAANLVTHPLAWWLLGCGLPWLPLELGVAASETFVYRAVTRLSWGRAVAAALLANSVTAALSFVPWP